MHVMMCLRVCLCAHACVQKALAWTALLLHAYTFNNFALYKSLFHLVLTELSNIIPLLSTLLSFLFPSFQLCWFCFHPFNMLSLLVLLLIFPKSETIFYYLSTASFSHFSAFVSNGFTSGKPLLTPQSILATQSRCSRYSPSCQFLLHHICSYLK